MLEVGHADQHLARLETDPDFTAGFSGAEPNEKIVIVGIEKHYE
jgi:hypothetical protein